MVVYLLYSNWMLNGDNAVNEVIGVYDCLRKAQQAVISNIHLDLQNRSFKHVKCDSSLNFDSYDIQDLSSLDFNDMNFNFDATTVRFWNGGEDDDLCEDYLQYDIEERLLL